MATATAAPQIPATIHSRCKRYGFKRIALGELSKKLSEIGEAENIQISDNGLAMIARAAEGSMRDAQSFLDQAVSFSGTAITDQDVQILLGTVGQESLSTFTANLIARKNAALREAQTRDGSRVGRDRRTSLERGDRWYGFLR